MSASAPFGRAVRRSLVAALWLWAGPAAAGADAGKPLTLEGLVAAALRDAEGLAARDLAAEAAALDARQARTWPGPELGLEAGRKEEGPDFGGLYKLAFSQSLPLSGKPGVLGSLGELDAEAARIERSAAQVELTLDVLKLAYATSGNRRKAAFVEARQRRFELVREYIAGREFLTPQRKAESRLVGNRLRALAAEAVRTEAELTSSLERLKAYVPSQPQPDVDAPWLTGTAPPSGPEAAARALTEDPGLRLQGVALKRARLEAELARKDGWPEPALTASYEQAKTAQVERGFGVGFALALPSWNANRAGAQGAALRATAQERLLSLSQRRLRAAVARVLLEAEAARAAAQRYPFSVVEEAEGHLKEAEEGFRRGQLDLLTFLELDASASETLNAAVDSQTGYVERLADLFALAQERDAAVKLAGY